MIQKLGSIVTSSTSIHVPTLFVTVVWLHMYCNKSIFGSLKIIDRSVDFENVGNHFIIHPMHLVDRFANPACNSVSSLTLLITSIMKHWFESYVRSIPFISHSSIKCKEYGHMSSSLELVVSLQPMGLWDYWFT
jgi:hypothetical protein